MIQASNEQVAAILHGTKADKGIEWKPYDGPIGEPLPGVVGIRLDWMFNFSNPPHHMFVYNGRLEYNSDLIYDEVSPGLYLGRDEQTHTYSQYFHKGPRMDREVEVFKGYEKDEAGKPIWLKPIKVKEIWSNCTPQEEGFAKRHYRLKMRDGSIAILRGPWHVGCLPGFEEVAYKEKINGKIELTPIGGLFVSIPDLAATYKKVAGNLDLLTVMQYNREQLQPALKKWNHTPKEVLSTRARAAGTHAYQEENWQQVFGTTKRIYDATL